MMPASPRIRQDATQELCSLHVNGMLYAVPIALVLEILGKPPVQPVPLAPDFIGGLIHYRGEALTGISLRRLLDLDHAPFSEDVLVFESPHGPFGLLVDSVGEVLRLSTAEHEPNPSTLDSRCQALFAGVWKLPDRLLIALDPDRLDPVRLASALADSRKASRAQPGD